MHSPIWSLEPGFWREDGGFGGSDSGGGEARAVVVERMMVRRIGRRRSDGEGWCIFAGSWERELAGEILCGSSRCLRKL